MEPHRWQPDAEPVSEFALIARLAPYLSGSGDDAAVLEIGGATICVAVDALVEGRHFDRRLSSLEDVGWKAVAVNVSDLAAMGARPVAVVVALLRPAGMAPDDVEALYRGMAAAGRRWGLQIAGGDTVRADELALSVTVVGAPAGRLVRRNGARPGDRLVVVGALGAAAAALAERDAGAPGDPALLAAHRRPAALVEAGIALAAHGATAMIDVSDGLGADVGHLCAASGVAAWMDAAALPLAPGVAAAAARHGLDPLALACGGGEDFALAAALPPGAAQDAAAAAGRADGVAAAVVGEFVAAAAGAGTVTLRLADGATRDVTTTGYDHYRPDEQERQP